MRTGTIKSAVAVLGVTVAVVGAGGAAHAHHANQSWGTVYTYDGNGNLLGSGNGSAYHRTSSGDQLAVNANYSDRRSNSHAVYVQSKWYFNGSFCYPAGGGTIGCGSGWYGDGKSETGRTTGSATGVLLTKALRGTANSARAGIQVCQDEGTWNPDTCNAETFRGFSY